MKISFRKSAVRSRVNALGLEPFYVVKSNKIPAVEHKSLYFHMVFVMFTKEQFIWQEFEAITNERNESQMSYVRKFKFNN
jgi:hypothetical protein